MKFSNLVKQNGRNVVLCVFCSVAFFGCGSLNNKAGANYSATDTTTNSCNTKATLISDIQGNTSTSPLVGQNHEIEAVVTVLAPNLNGFFVQEEFRDFDNNDNSSEGLFVFTENVLVEAATGQVLRLRGNIEEQNGRTQLSLEKLVAVCTSTAIRAIDYNMPIDNRRFERYEGMLVNFVEPLTIINTYNFSRFGEIYVSDELLYNPTQIYSPSSQSAQTLLTSNAVKQIILDDLNAGAPDNLSVFGKFNASSSKRIGSTLSDVTGVVDEAFNNFRIRLSQPPTLSPKPRPELPQLTGNITIAAFNVLNLFNGDGKGGGFPTSRGAQTSEEYKRQQNKVIQAIMRLGPDVIGLNEIENDGQQQQTSAISQLSAALNKVIGHDAFGYITYAGSPDGPSIANGILYRKDKLRPVGDTKILTSQNSDLDQTGPLFNTQKNRPAITQAFSVLGLNKPFVVSVNHFKSKGSSCGEGDDSAMQGNCNLTRTRAAVGLTQWLNKQYKNIPIFIIGDLNSYAQEDPITTFAQSGYIDVVRESATTQTYTYSFRGQLGTLDYVLANTLANDMVVSAFEWHINAAEPRVLDYKRLLPNSDNAKPVDWLSENEYRSSDHDPVVVSIKL